MDEEREIERWEKERESNTERWEREEKRDREMGEGQRERDSDWRWRETDQTDTQRKNTKSREKLHGKSALHISLAWLYLFVIC